LTHLGNLISHGNSVTVAISIDTKATSYRRGFKNQMAQYYKAERIACGMPSSFDRGGNKSSEWAVPQVRKEITQNGLI
jgi:hypothetical protein